MPNIEVLRIFLPEHSNWSAENQEKLMRATPNANTLLMVDGYVWDEGEGDSNFVDQFRAIARNLTKLEHFGWVISRSTHYDLLYSLDSAITGLPEDICKNLLAKFRNEQRLPGDLASYESKRIRPSILDLKGKTTDD